MNCFFFFCCIPAYNYLVLAYSNISMTCVRLAHLNVRSLLPKLQEITDLLINQGIDVLVLTETWLDQRVHHGIKFDGYSISRYDRDGRGGGGAQYF